MYSIKETREELNKAEYILGELVESADSLVKEIADSGSGLKASVEWRARSAELIRAAHSMVKLAIDRAYSHEMSEAALRE